MTGQIRRESAAKAMRLAGDVALKTFGGTIQFRRH